MALPNLLLPARSVCIGWATSFTVHATVLAVLVLNAVWPFLDIWPAARKPPKHAIALDSRLLGEEDSTVLSSPVTVEPVVAAAVAYPQELVDFGLITNTRAADSEAATNRHAQDVFRERVDAKVLIAIEKAQSIDEDENRDHLQKLAGQLNRVSSERSIDDLAGRFQQWLGTDKRADKPAEGKIAGEFDFATAQLHDVRRERDEAGQWRYISVLVDAAGRKLETELDAIEGESSFKTFQLMRSNPLAELVYRRIAMSLMDNLIKAGQEAQRALPTEVPAAAPPPADSNQIKSNHAHPAP